MAQDSKPEQVFSGPQKGESLVSFDMTHAIGENADEVVDVVKLAGEKPILLIFFHEKTRPAFGLMRTLAKFGVSKKDKGLTSAVCFLTPDPTETSRWVKQVGRNLPKGATYGVFAGGVEGPGSLGLNRNVALTVLVADKGKVVHNSALVQPSLETDGSKIIKAIVEVTGGGKVPSVRELAGARDMARQRPAGRGNEPNMRPWLVPVIKKTATQEEVDDAAAELEEHCQSNPSARKAIGRISDRIVSSGKLENYGTKHAQAYLKKWAKEFNDANSDSDNTDKASRRDKSPAPSDKGKNAQKNLGS